jgi:hypothetical protein
MAISPMLGVARSRRLSWREASGMRELRPFVALVALSIIVAACGDTPATPAPSASSAPTASAAASEPEAPAESAEPVASAEPSAPTAAELAALAMADPNLETTLTLDSTTKVGKTTTRTTGTIDVSGRASHLVRTDKTGKSTATTETLTANGSRYVKTKGVWTKGGAADDTDLAAILRGVTTYTDQGVEDRDGQLLTHLQADVPTIPRELALVTKGVTDASGTLDVWVKDDGTPVSATLTSTWTQPDGKKTVDGSRTTDITFGEPLAEAPIIAPTETWKFFNSKRYRYRMAAPDTWTTRPGKGTFADSFDGGQEIAYASRARNGGRSLSYINSRILSQLKSITNYKNLKVTANKKTKLDGVPARRIEFRGTNQGDTVYGQAVFANKGPFWYFIGYDSYDKWSDESRATFSSMVNSFDFR